MNFARIKKADDDLQIVYAEVYAPNRPDSGTDFMEVIDLRKMAHEFIRSGKVNKIDTQHDNIENGSSVVESWVQQEESELYIKDAWCVGIHVPDEDTWALIKKGDITGFSMEALVEVEQVDALVDIPPVIKGTTLEDSTGHIHTFSVKFNSEGIFLGGSTNSVDGHSHEITDLTRTVKVVRTVKGESEEHFHRVYLMEGVEIEVQS
jgi:hypothetical protein